MSDSLAGTALPALACTECLLVYAGCGGGMQVACCLLSARWHRLPPAAASLHDPAHPVRLGGPLAALTMSTDSTQVVCSACCMLPVRTHPHPPAPPPPLQCLQHAAAQLLQLTTPLAAQAGHLHHVVAQHHSALSAPPSTGGCCLLSLPACSWPAQPHMPAATRGNNLSEWLQRHSSIF